MSNNIMKHDYLEETGVYGYYFLSNETCKNIIISAGVSGVHPALSVKKVSTLLRQKKGAMGNLIPALRNINHDVISQYSGKLAECLVYAACSGKDLEIAMGYPKILSISVN